MNAEVFVSYSSLDRDRVMPVVESLRGNGISVWVDEGNIHAADLWSEQIVQAIASCQVMVVMLSGNSTDSHNVVKEAMLASEQKKALLPVYLEPAEIPAKLQYQLAGIQHLELYGQDEQQVLEDLANSLAKRGVNREGEAVVSQPTTVKRHEKPKPKFPSGAQSKNLTKPIAWVLAASILLLLTLVYFKSPPLADVNINNIAKSNIGRIHLKIPISKNYPFVKPTEMPFGVQRRSLAISNDGKYFVYVCMYENERYLCLRDLGSDFSELMKGSQGALLPFFSPDAKWLGFVTEDKIKKIELSSGLLKVLCDANNPYAGATWSSDGAIYFGDSEGGVFLKVSENGGKPSLVTDKISRLLELNSPFLDSSESGILFRSPGIRVSRGPSSIFYYNLNSNKIVRLKGGQTPEIYQKKYLVTAENGQLTMNEFDFDSLQSVGDAISVLNEEILYEKYSAQYSLSMNNILVFLKGESSRETQLTILDSKNKQIKPLVDRKEIYGQYAISPNGNRIAIEVLNNNISDIMILDIKRSRLNSFTESRHNFTPFWSQDGQKVYYTSNREDPAIVMLYEYDFTSRKEQLIQVEGEVMNWFNISDVSNNGKHLLCFGHEGGRLGELYLINLEDKKRTQLTNNQLNEWGAVFSNDEKWIAYTSEKDMEGSYAIYLNRFPEMDEETRISAGGGEEPKWLPDGSGVYYRNGSQWMKVSLKLDEKMEIGEPELFFEGDYVNVWGPSHDVFPDGRILLLKGEEWVPPTEIDVIINALDVVP